MTPEYSNSYQRHTAHTETCRAEGRRGLRWEVEETVQRKKGRGERSHTPERER